MYYIYLIVLYCTALYYTVLYLLCCNGLFFIVLYCNILHCNVLCCNVLYCTLLYCLVLFCIVLHCTTLYLLYCTLLYYILLHFIVSYCNLLYCVQLYCNLSYCTVLYCLFLCFVMRIGGMNICLFGKHWHCTILINCKWVRHTNSYKYRHVHTHTQFSYTKTHLVSILVGVCVITCALMGRAQPECIRCVCAAERAGKETQWPSRISHHASSNLTQNIAGWAAKSKTPCERL